MTDEEARRAGERHVEAAVHRVQLYLCDSCLDGKGGECHMPGCVFWFNQAPGMVIRSLPGVTVLNDETDENPS